MDKKKVIITTIAAMVMFFMMSMSALAVTNVHISLPENQVWTPGKSVSRSGDYSCVLASCNSVYPASGTDNFTKIQARLVNSSNTLIMKNEYEVLEEGNPVDTPLYIKEGYLSLRTVYIQFRGNKNAAAEAIVSYLSF